MSCKRRLLSCLLLLAATVSANPAKLFREGNKALAEQRFEEAAARYSEAAEHAPETPEIHYNLGQAHYRAGQFEEAAAGFEYAAALAGSDALRSRAWYNMGNCMVRLGEGLREADPQSAVEYCRQAAWLYRMALDGPAAPDAAFNLEMVQRIAAGIEEQIRAQEEQEKQENELVKYIREKLQEFIDRQTRLNEGATAGEPQRQLETEVRALADVMKATGLHEAIALPDGTILPGPLQETFGHTIKAADAMAVPDQPLALAELVAALGSAPQDPDQQEGESNEESETGDESDMEYEESEEEADLYEEADPFGDFSEYEEIRGVPPPNQTEMDILTEEIRNQERRKEKKAGEYKAVEKDW